MIADKNTNSKSFFNIKDKEKQQAGTKLGYTSSNRKIQLDGGETVLISGVKPEQLSNSINTKKYNIRNFFPLTAFAFIQRKFILIHLIVIIISIGIHDDNNFTVDRVQLFAVFLSPILISYSIYILLIFIVERNKGIFDRTANERKSLVFNKHRNKLFEEDQTVIEQQINLSDQKKWKDIQVGDIIIINKDEHCPCEVLVLDFQGENCILDMQQINGNTVYKKVKPLKVTRSQQQAKNKGNQIDFRKMLKGMIEYSKNEFDELKGYIKLKQDPQVEQFSDENIIPRSAIIKQEWVFCIALYTGLECKQFKHQIFNLNKEKESFFLNKIEFFCLFHYLLLIPILVQKLIFQASSSCYTDIENSQRFYFKSFNLRQLFITITDSLSLFPIIIYIIFDAITLIEIYLQNHEIVFSDDNQFLRLKSLAEIKSSKKPNQQFENGGQQNIASEQNIATQTKIQLYGGQNQQSQINFSVVQNNRDKSVSIVNHIKNSNKKNKFNLRIFQKCFQYFSQKIKQFQRNFTEKLIYPRFRIREPIPIADLSVTSHVIIGKTNIISYPYSSDVCKVLFGEIQYKFQPEKISQKYNEFMTKYENLKKKLSETKQMKKLGLNFKRKRISEKTDFQQSVTFDKLGFSENPLASDDKLTLYNNTLALSEYQNGAERDAGTQYYDSTVKINLKKQNAEKNPFQNETNQIYQRPFSLNNLQESPEFRSNLSRTNINQNYLTSNGTVPMTNNKKAAESIILEESNLSIKTKIGASGGGNSNKGYNIFEHLVTRSDRHQSLASNIIKDSENHIEEGGQQNIHNESSFNAKKQKLSQSLNQINQQFNSNLNRFETMNSLNRVNHNNSITELALKGDLSSRNRTNTLQKQKSHYSDNESVLNASSNQINSISLYQKNSINAVRQSRDEQKNKQHGQVIKVHRPQLSVDFEEEEIPNEKESSFKKEYMNETSTVNKQSFDQKNEKPLSSRQQKKQKYQPNNLNVISITQPETMRHLMEENIEDGEIKYPPYFLKPPSQNSRVLSDQGDEDSSQEQSMDEQAPEQGINNNKIKYLLQVKDANLLSKDKQNSINKENNLQVDEITDNDIPSEKVSEKNVNSRQFKSISHKFENSSATYSWQDEINSEMNESSRLKNNAFGTNMNSIHHSAQKKFILTNADKGNHTNDEMDQNNFQSSSTQKEKQSNQKEKHQNTQNQSSLLRQRSFSLQFIPHPFFIIEEQEEDKNTPRINNLQKDYFSESSNISDKQQLSQSNKQQIEQQNLIHKDNSRRFSLEESLSRSSKNQSIRFGVASKPNNNYSQNQQSFGFIRRSSQFKQYNGILNSEETPRNSKKSLRIDLAHIEDINYQKFLNIINNREEQSVRNQNAMIPGEIDDQKQNNTQRLSIESPQLGRYMTAMWEKQESGRKSKSGSVRDFNDMNSVDSIKRNRQYQLSIHSRDQENQKIERKPAKQFTFQTRQMASSSIRYDKHDLLSNPNNLSNMESHIQESSQHQIQQLLTLGQVSESVTNKKRGSQLFTSGNEKSQAMHHKRSIQFEQYSCDNPFEEHYGQGNQNEDDQNNFDDEDDDDDDLDNDDENYENEDEANDEQKSSNLQIRDKFISIDKRLCVPSEVNSKNNDSINEVKSDIYQRNRNDAQNMSVEKREQIQKRKKSSKNLNKSTLPKISFKRESLEMGQLSARLNLSPVKTQSQRFFGKNRTQLKPSQTLLSDSNQEHHIPKDMDKFLEHYIKENSIYRKQIRNSLKCLTLCHQTVTMFDIDKNQPIHTSYNEDEEMILRFAKNLGYDFKVQNIKLNEDNLYKQEYIVKIQSKIKRYEIIAFHRKKFRFSILVKRKNGADLIMREELKTVPLYLDFQRDLMAKIIHKNMQNGFRSVLISKYSLNLEETEKFVNQLGNLQTNIVKEREAIERLFGIYEERESSMQFVVLLGVREKLRENTDIFLNSLYNNKIKTWMLTGEQYTRALSSAYLSKIVKSEDSKNQNNLINIHFESPDYDDIKFIIRRNLEKVQVHILGEDQEKNSAFHNKDKHTKFQRKKSNLTFATNQLEQQLQFQIIIKGDVLRIILEDPFYLKNHFLFLCHFCKGFVAYETDSETKKMLVKALKQQESQNRFLAITNDVGLSNIAHFSVEIENPQNSSSYQADVCIDTFQDLYKLIFLHGRRQADFINTILNFQVYRQMLFYIVSLITEDCNCVEGENPMNQIEITIFNYILNFFSIIPLFISYFNPKDPEKLKKDEDENLKYYSMQYQTTRDLLSRTQITTYCKLLVAALIQSLIIYFSMDQIMQFIQNDGKLIGYEETRMIIFIMTMVVTQFQVVYFSRIRMLLNIIYQIFIFFISTVIYLAWKSDNNTMFRVLAELFYYPSFFISFVIFSFIACMIFEFLHSIVYIMPFFLEQNLELISKAIVYFENNYQNLRASRLAESKREGDKPQTNHLTLLGIIRQYFKGQTEIDEIVLSMMNTGYDNIHTGISKYTQKFDNPEFEQKYIKRTIGYQINFSKVISLILFFTFDTFLLVIIVLDDSYKNSEKVILITLIAIVCILTFMKWYRYEQFFIIFNYGLILARVGYLIAAIQIINDYDNFLVMLVFMYILYFNQLVRIDIVVVVYTFFALYDSINFVIGIQSEKFAFSKEYLSYYIINALTLISAFTYLLLSQKYQYGMMDRQQYLSANKLQLEMQKFNEVLSILLPKFIRDQIQSDNQNVVKIENQVSIIFCDIYNFDDIIAKKNVEVIKLLDNLYRAFDILCNLNGLQKIETVGKTYMACGGIVQNKLQQREGQYSEFNEVKCAINFAFEILEYSSTLTFGDDGERIQLKIGIHFGGVIAGVIGFHKPQFSLIGDTVNTTSRVCSTSDPGTVTLSEQAYERVKESDFKVQQMDKFEKLNEKLMAKQKKVEAKGKGELITYQVQKNKNKKSDQPAIRNRRINQNFDSSNIKQVESPQSENIVFNTDQNSIGDQQFDSNEKNNVNLLLSPTQQIRKKQTIALQQQLQNQQKDQELTEIKENGLYSSSQSNLHFQRRTSVLVQPQQIKGKQDQQVNQTQQLQGDNQSQNDGVPLTYSRHISNIQITPQGLRTSSASLIINTPDGMLKSNTSKISISNQNALILGHNITQTGQNTTTNNINISIPGPQTNSILNYQGANSNMLLYSPNLLAIRAEKSDTNANELLSNMEIDQKTKMNTIDQQRSHNFSLSHNQELKSEMKSNRESLLLKIPQNQYHEENNSQKPFYNSGMIYVNGQPSTPQQNSPSKNVSSISQKMKLKNNNLPKNIANLLQTINNNNNEVEDLTPSVDSKKIPSKHHSSAESRKNTSNNTLPKNEEFLSPFTNSGNANVNPNIHSQRGSTNSGAGGNVKNVNSKRKKSIFNPNQVGHVPSIILADNNQNKVNSNDKIMKLKPPSLGFDKPRHTVYGTGIQSTMNTPQSKTSIQKLHKIKHIQGFSDLVINQLPNENSAGKISGGKLQGSNKQLPMSSDKKDGYRNSKSYTEFDNDQQSKNQNPLKLNNLAIQLQKNQQDNGSNNTTNNNNTPQIRSPNQNKKIRTPDNNQSQNQNNLNNFQYFLSKGMGKQNDQNSSQQASDVPYIEISPPFQDRKSFFQINNLNPNQVSTPPFKTRSHRVINMMNYNTLAPNVKNSGGNSNLSKASNQSQALTSSMHNLPDKDIKKVFNNIRNIEKNGNTPMSNSNRFRRGSSAQNVGWTVSNPNDNKSNANDNKSNANDNKSNANDHKSNGSKNNIKQFNQQDSLQDNKSAYSKQSSQNEKYRKNYKQCISQEEKSEDNQIKNMFTTQNQNNPTDIFSTNRSKENNLFNQINIQIETSPNNNNNKNNNLRRNSTIRSKQNQEINLNTNNPNQSGTNINNPRSPELTPTKQGKFAPFGVNHRSSSNTANQSLRSSNTPLDQQIRKMNSNDMANQGYINQFIRNQAQIDNATQANQLKNQTLEKRLTEFTIRSKSNTKSSKFDNKSPALTHQFLVQQTNSQLFDNDFEKISEEEGDGQAKDDQESLISCGKKPISFFHQEINEKVNADRKYRIENQVDPSNLRKVYDEQDLEEQVEKKQKKKDQNDQFKLTFKDVLPFKRWKRTESEQEAEFELSKDFFAQQISKAQDSSRINLWMWLIIYVLKTISFLVVREKLFSLFILMVVLRALFIIGFSFFLYKMKLIFNMWKIKRIKFLIYILYAIQYLFFYIETSLMILKSSNTFSANLQTAEQFFAFVVFTEFIFQYYSEKILICFVFILSEILLSIFKDGYFRLMTLLSITLFSSLYHLIMHYIILSFQINSFNDIRNLEFKRLLYKRFLYNLLPSHIMGQLLSQQNEQSELIDSLQNTTLLFADIAGFTNYCSGKDPEKVLYMLQNLFVQFDKACIYNEVYKVYTIGDCYVVMGTLNAKQRKPAIEAKNVINMAFSMINAIEEAKKKEYSDIDMRIGIHTGDIIGGVIGTDIVRYDIYGPNVLIANKMESNGERGRVMISETTYKLVKGSFPNSFNFFPKEDIVIIKSLNNLQVKAYFVGQKSDDKGALNDGQGFQDNQFVYNPEDSGEEYDDNEEIDQDDEAYSQQDQQFDEENYEDEQYNEEDGNNNQNISNDQDNQQ